MTPQKEQLFEILLAEKLKEIAVPVVNKNVVEDKDYHIARISKRQLKNIKPR